MAFQSKIKKAMEMKSQLISGYYKHEQDQKERSGYSDVFEMCRNCMLVYHLLRLIQHFRVTGMDCLPRLLFSAYRQVVKWPGRETDHSPLSSARVE